MRVKTVPHQKGESAVFFSYVSTRQVAEFLGCSDRRVRALLSQGRMAGHKGKGGSWSVYWPLRVDAGRRGPDLRGYPVRRLRLVKSNG